MIAVCARGVDFFEFGVLFVKIGKRLPQILHYGKRLIQSRVLVEIPYTHTGKSLDFALVLNDFARYYVYERGLTRAV